jgi:hypothetical protein
MFLQGKKLSNQFSKLISCFKDSFCFVGSWFILFSFTLTIIDHLYMSPVYCANGYGLTYAKVKQRLNNGIEFVGCGQQANIKLDQPLEDPKTNETKCNIYEGDTLCTKYLPILCINSRISIPWPFGSTNISAQLTNTPEMHWSGSYVATTMPVLGTSLRSVDSINYLCEIHLGLDWRAYEVIMFFLDSKQFKNSRLLSYI